MRFPRDGFLFQRGFTMRYFLFSLVLMGCERSEPIAETDFETDLPGETDPETDLPAETDPETDLPGETDETDEPVALYGSIASLDGELHFVQLSEEGDTLCDIRLHATGERVDISDSSLPFSGVPTGFLLTTDPVDAAVTVDCMKESNLQPYDWGLEDEYYQQPLFALDDEFLWFMMAYGSPSDLLLAMDEGARLREGTGFNRFQLEGDTLSYALQDHVYINDIFEFEPRACDFDEDGSVDVEEVTADDRVDGAIDAAENQLVVNATYGRIDRFDFPVTAGETYTLQFSSPLANQDGYLEGVYWSLADSEDCLRARQDVLPMGNSQHTSTTFTASVDGSMSINVGSNLYLDQSDESTLPYKIQVTHSAPVALTQTHDDYSPESTPVYNDVRIDASFELIRDE